MYFYINCFLHFVHFAIIVDFTYHLTVMHAKLTVFAKYHSIKTKIAVLKSYK